MCLYVKNPNPRTAESTITVFKLVKKDFDNSCYRPIYCECEKEYRISETAYPSDEYYKANNDFQIIKESILKPGYSIYGGAIHSSSNLFGALCQYNPIDSIGNFAVLKCFIKKGTRYFCDSERRCYASENLFIAEEVEDLGYVFRFMFFGGLDNRINVYSKETADGEIRYYLTDFYKYGTKKKVEIDKLY